MYSGRTGVLLGTFTGEAASDRFGISVSGAGDVDGDGFANLIVGAERNDAGGTDAGRAYVYTCLPPCPPNYGGAGEFPCACDCHADPECDGVCNVLDVATSVGVAFRGSEAPTDPNCPTIITTDVDCDNDTDVFDVVRFVNVAFRNQPTESNFCDPMEP